MLRLFVGASWSPPGSSLRGFGRAGKEGREHRLVFVVRAAATRCLLEKACRRQAREYDALTYKVRLVGVAGRPGKAAEPILGVLRVPVQREEALEAHDSLHCLGAVAEGSLAAAAQLAVG